MSFSNFKENLAERYANFKARMQERADRKICFYDGKFSFI